MRDTRGGVRRLTLELPGRFLSSLHARLVKLGDAWVLEDAQSKNGCFVNGERGQRALLRSTDVFEMGHKFFMLVKDDPTPHDTFRDVDAESSSELRGMVTLLPSLASGFASMRRIAPTALSVILAGETGTGKELVSRALHELSTRSGSFVAVNCGALTETLAESQLFGHVRGAFSGAVRDEPGFVRSAQRGTLLLDEIGDLPLATQPALLRVLQEREVVPVGSSSKHDVDVRFVAATHADLGQRVEDGEFRRDLYTRLNGFAMNLPPLRERMADFGTLLSDPLSTSGAQATLAPEAARALLAYAWPGNIRELDQCVQRALALSSDGMIRKRDLPLEISEPGRPIPEVLDRIAAPSSGWSKDELDHRARLIRELKRHEGNVAGVARAFGKARVQIQRWMKRYDLEAKRFRT
jgi:transcriptional regulator with GAF, ATPase, and Fis domain